jgi:hypothetical protein
MRGPSIFILVAVCLASSSRADEPSANSVHKSVDRAIHYLQTDSAAWLSQRKCAACHHASMPFWALAEADKHGYTIDKKLLTDSIESTIGSREKMIASGLVARPDAPPDTRPMAKGVSTGQVFIAFAAESQSTLTDSQQQNVAWMINDAIKKQRDDGSWDFYLSRPPINENQATDHAWITMALQGEKDSASRDSHKAALEKASTWLAQADPADNPQVKRLKVLVALRAHEPREKLQPDLDELLKFQNPDGGWAQLPESKSDAFATGESLYILSLAGYTPANPQIQRGIDYLLTTQSPDGSWPMTSRASPDGRPGGSAKLLTPIISGATSWSILALAQLEPRTNVTGGSR